MGAPSRHQLGQWFTPESVVSLALGLARREQGAPESVLDPSCGDGAFLCGADELWGQGTRVLGTDVDPRALSEATRRLPRAELVEGDFFREAERYFDQIDLVAGNPPYVRQERLEPGYKELVLAALRESWPDLDGGALEALVGRGDLAAPFVLVALRCLRPGARAAFVLSTAFLDSDYGMRCWQLMAQIADVELLVDAPEERWFHDAAVHTFIAVIRRRGGSDARVSEPRVLRLSGACEQAAVRLQAGDEIEKLGNIRPCGRDSSHWASFLRAPAEFFELLELMDSNLCPLGELGTLRRGLTTGANDFFYLSRSEAENCGIHERYLRPLLRQPGKGARIAQSLQVVETFVLDLPADESPEAIPGLELYLQQHPGIEERSTLRARSPWWRLQLRPAKVFLAKAYAERYLQPFASTPMVADQRLYAIQTAAGVDAELLSAVLNGSASSLVIESSGRASMGQGALECSVSDARSMPIIDPRRLNDPERVRRAFRALRSRVVGKLSEERHAADRRELDLALLDGLPSATGALDALWDGLCRTNARRQQRGRL